MTTALSVLNNTPTNLAVTQGGLGVNFGGSRLFATKPATLGIIQQNSQGEGKKGSLRISETGDVFPELTATFLATPHERRQCYSRASAGQMNKTFEDLICYSRDGITPDPKARDIQAPFCDSCPQSNWDAWREYKEEHNGVEDKSLRPLCEEEVFAVILDTRYKMPLQMYVKGKSVKPFKKQMQILGNLFDMAAAQGKTPNIFDVKFSIKTKQITTGKFVSYIYDIGNFEFVTPEEREAFGAVYLRYVNQATQTKPQSQVQSRPKNDDYEEGQIIQSITQITQLEPEYVDSDLSI